MERINENFDIPFYIFESITKYLELSAKGYYQKDKWNEIVMLINMAVMNKTISEEQGKKLKRRYCREKDIFHRKSLEIDP